MKMSNLLPLKEYPFAINVSLIHSFVIVYTGDESVSSITSTIFALFLGQSLGVRIFCATILPYPPRPSS